MNIDLQVGSDLAKTKGYMKKPYETLIAFILIERFFFEVFEQK